MRERERERDRQTERERQTDRQTDRQTKTETDRQTSRQTETEMWEKRKRVCYLCNLLFSDVTHWMICTLRQRRSLTQNSGSSDLCQCTLEVLHRAVDRLPHTHTLSIAFRHLPPNSARFGYVTKGALFISAQLSTDAVSTLRKVRVLIRLWKQPSA